MDKDKIELNQAEHELISMLRDARRFRSVEIAIRSGRWHVQSHVDRDGEPFVLFGSGKSLDEAWADRQDPRLRFSFFH